MKRIACLTTAILISTWACGREDKKSPDATQATGGTTQGGTTEDPTNLMLEDEQLAGDNVSNTVDDAISDVLEGSESKDATSGGFSLGDTDSVNKVSRFRECKVDGATAVVTIKRSIERERTVSKFNRSGSTVLKQLLEKSRTWSKEGGSVACSANGKHAAIDRANLQGVTLVSKFTREHLQASTFENSKKGIKIAQSRSSKSTGEKTIKWTSVKTEGANLVLTKEIKATSTRSFESKNKKGETKSFETTMSTDANNPLIVMHERDKTTDKVVSHTIVSGKKIATHKSGTRVETSFSNVKYLTNDGCYASSGKIEGSIFAKDATKASATFVVDFSGDSKTVVMTKADGTVVETEYVADGCDFDGQESEEAAGAAADKAKASDISLKI